MKIEVHFARILNLQGLTSGQTIEIEDGSSVADLLNRYRVKEEHQRFILPVINGQHQHQAYCFKDNDRVELFVPVGGG